MYGVLTSGGEWFLGVSEEQAPAAATACLVAAGIYGAYLIFCVLRMGKSAATGERQKLHDDDDDE